VEILDYRRRTSKAKNQQARKCNDDLIGVNTFHEARLHEAFPNDFQ
jgi:hypothetical protein